MLTLIIYKLFDTFYLAEQRRQKKFNSAAKLAK
jgi:uncharacterized protein (DUF486 family)